MNVGPPDLLRSMQAGTFPNVVQFSFHASSGASRARREVVPDVNRSAASEQTFQAADASPLRVRNPSGAHGMAQSLVERSPTTPRSTNSARVSTSSVGRSLPPGLYQR